MTLKPTLHIDTSTQIHRLFGTKIVRDKLDGELLQYQPSTSSMAYIEFKGTMLQAMASVVRTLKECELHQDAKVRLGDLVRRLSEDPKTTTHAQAKRVMKVAATLIDRFTRYIPTAAEVETYIVGEIEKMALYRFFEFGGEFIRFNEKRYINLTQCPLAHDDVIPGLNLFQRMSCRRDAKVCQVRSLLRNNLDIVETIANAFEFLPRRSKVRDENALVGIDLVRELLEKTESSDSKSLGEKCCWALADIIICLECPKECQHIHSSDNHFVAICQALGKTSVISPIN